MNDNGVVKMRLLEADVLLFAAGFGKRLLPLTATRPKPLLEAGGKALINYALDLTIRSGAERAIINTHHLAEQIVSHLGDGSKYGIEIVYSHEEQLLETGGGIKNVEPLLKYPRLITVNSDTLYSPDFSLADLLQSHLSHTPIPSITAVLREDLEIEKYGAIGIDRDGFVTSFLGTPFDARTETERLMYAGTQVIEREVIEEMPPDGSSFSVTSTTWQALLRQGKRIASYRYDAYWSDVGTPERLERASKDVATVYRRALDY